MTSHFFYFLLILMLYELEIHWYKGVLDVGHNVSFSKCAALYGIAKGSVQKHIERARKKIVQKVEELRAGERGLADVG